jgi:hypothetical protein
MISYVANWATVYVAGRVMKLLFGSADWKIEGEVINKLARALAVTLVVTIVILLARCLALRLSS